MLNNVIGLLKYDIAAGATALVVTPVAGTSFNLPPGGTDASGVTTGGIPTFGKPVETLILADRLDLSQAKFEIIQATTRAPEAAGAYTHQVLSAGRGAEGSTALAWVAANVVYVLQVTTAGMIDLLANAYAMRAQHMLSHQEGSILSWDATTFKFGTFRALGAGRGPHASSVGYLDIAMPANGSVATGYGGAANVTVASGGFPLLTTTALYYEPNIGGDGSVTTAGNFKVVGYTSNFIVPAHWIFIASHHGLTGGGLRVGNGAYLPTIHNIGAGGEPAFLNSWVNYGSGYTGAQFSKDENGRVTVRGMVKSGATTSGTPIFTLPAGFRPAAPEIFVSQGGDSFACLEVTAAGNVNIRAGSNTFLSLNLSFIAGA